MSSAPTSRQRSASWRTLQRASSSFLAALRSAPDAFRRFIRHRAVRVSGSILAVLYVAYVVAAWSLLSHGGLASLSEGLKNARFQTESGYSFWPGRITASGAEMVFQDPNITMQVLAEEVKIDFGVLSLLQKELHLERFEAEGGKFRLRHRVKSNLEGHQERLAAFPVIEGFERTPLRGPRGPRAKHPLKVRVDEIQAQVEEVWIMEYRTTGDFHARGGFRLNDQVEVLPCHVDLSAARTTVGSREVIETQDCKLQAQLGPFPRRKPTTQEIVQSISSQVRCRVEALELSVAQLYPRDTPFQVTGRVKADADVTMNEGKLARGALRFFEAETPWTWNGVRLPMIWDALLEFSEPGTIHGELHARIVGGEHSSRVRQADLVFQAKHDVLFEQKLQRLQAEVDGLAFEDGRFLRNFTKNPKAPLVRLHPSRGELVYAPKDGSFRANADVSAHLDMKDASVGVDGSAKVECRSQDDQTVRCDQVSLDARGLSYQKNGDVESLPVSVRATEFEGHFPRSMDARFKVDAGNPKAFLKHALGLAFLERLGLSLLPLGKLHATLDLARKDSTLVGSIPDFQSGNIHLRGRFVSATAWTSAWLIGTPVGHYGIRQKPGSVKFHPWVGQEWFSSCDARLLQRC